MNSSRFLTKLAPVLMATCLSVASPAVAQVTTNNALPIGKDQALVRFQAIYLRATEDNRTLQERNLATVFGYGVTRNLAVFTSVPFVNRQVTVGNRTRQDFGLGDIGFLARYTVFERNQAGKTLRIAPIVGLEIPTGNLGSRTFDPSLGITLTRQTLKNSFSTSLVYQLNTQANAVEFGDELRLDLAYKYRVFPQQLRSGFLFLGLESNLIVQGRNQLNGQVDQNSGNTTWFVAPSVQYVAKSFVLEGAVQIPVQQVIPANALETRIRLILGGQVNF